MESTGRWMTENKIDKKLLEMSRAARVRRAPDELARGAIGHVMKNKLTGESHTITAIESLSVAGGRWSGLIVLDHGQRVSLTDLAENYKKVGHVDCGVQAIVTTGEVDARSRISGFRMV